MVTRFWNSRVIAYSVGLLYPALAVFLLLAILAYSPASLPSGLADPEILAAVKLSLIAAITATIGAVIAGTPLAYLLARHDFRGKMVLETLIDLAISIPPLVCGVGLLLLFGRKGWIGQPLAALGISFVFSLKGAIIAQFFVATPLFVKAMQTAIKTIDVRYEMVARSLGARPLRVFFTITMPLSWEGLVNGVTMAFARGLSEFGATLMLAGAVSYQTATLPVTVFINMSTGDIDRAIAAALILIFVALFLILSTRWVIARFKRGIEHGT
ncbi:MAG: ABC transporter permease [bacterium]|nr:ABC transporter permease [bacterium]